MGDNMKKKLGVMAILFLILSLHQLGCQEDTPAMEWTFEPHTDRSVHVKAVISIGEDIVSYAMTGISREYWIKNLTAYEYESRKSISSEIQYDSATDTQTIMLTFKDPHQKDSNVQLNLISLTFWKRKRIKSSSLNGSSALMKKDLIQQWFTSRKMQNYWKWSI